MKNPQASTEVSFFTRRPECLQQLRTFNHRSSSSSVVLLPSRVILKRNFQLSQRTFTCNESLTLISCWFMSSYSQRFEYIAGSKMTFKPLHQSPRSEIVGKEEAEIKTRHSVSLSWFLPPKF